MENTIAEILERKRSERSRAASVRAQQASKLCWQLAIAGFVVTWLFKDEAKVTHAYVYLFGSIISFAISVLIQVAYLVGSSIIMLRYSTDKLTQIEESGNEVPNIIPHATIKRLWIIWFSSFPFAFIGYVLLGIVFYHILCC